MTASTTWRNKGKHVLAGIGAAVFWLFVWQGISLLVAQELLVPGPAAVLRTLIGLAGTADFWKAAGMSLLRVMIGFLAAVAAGSVLAVLTVRFAVCRWLFTPLLKIVRAAPVA